MLIRCPECELQVSDKAIACPHCGYPLRPEAVQRKPRGKSNKRRRLPNGFGQISEIKNRNLRNPFRAMVTVGKDENGRPICKPLKPDSYFQTYNDAYAALVEYNRNPYDLGEAITMAELYERWLPEYEKKVKNINAMTAAWQYCSAVYDMRVKDLRARHIKGCIDDGVRKVKGGTRTATPSTKSCIKTLFNKLLDYAVEYELVDRNYAKTFKLDEDTTRELTTVQNEHIAFSPEEMKQLWYALDEVDYVDMILIDCYSGWRPQEMGLIKLESVDLRNWCFTGGIKTEAGMNRTVPIHSKIRPLVEKRYNEAKEIGSLYLFNYTNVRRNEDTFFTYGRYKRTFNKIKAILNLNPNHRLHDCRKQFVTMAKQYNVDEYAIKYMVGHTIADITEKVYTQRELSWLRDEIEKIK